MRKEILLVGGGGHCKSVIEVIESTNTYVIAGIVDKKELVGSVLSGYPVIGSDDDLENYCNQGYLFHITVGHIKSGLVRSNLFNRIKKAGGQFPVIIASTAYVSKLALLSEGTIVMHKAFINADVHVGENTIINTAAVIEHDAQIGSHCHISTGAFINGACKVGAHSFIGSSSVLVQGIEIAPKNVIGAGSVVTSSTLPDSLYVGAPAKAKKKSD